MNILEGGVGGACGGCDEKGMGKKAKIMVHIMITYKGGKVSPENNKIDSNDMY